MKEYFAIALEYDVSVIFFTFDEYADYFQGTCRGVVCSFPKQYGPAIGKSILSRVSRCVLQIIGRIVNVSGCNTASVFPEPDNNGCHVLEGQRAEILKKRVVLFHSGWPCVSEGIIEKHSEQIRGYFSLVEEHASIVKRVIAEARTFGDFLIGIHIRQGDYRVWNDGKCYHDTDAYVEMMKKIVHKHDERNVVFIVCSNEEQNWSLFEGLSYVVGPGDAVGDMYSLAGCDEIYGPQSSFSAWASFYGKVPLFGIQDFNSDVSGHYK